jgi:hypothetical protein
MPTRTAVLKQRLVLAAIGAAALGGCATVPPDHWACEPDGPCYRIYEPAYAYSPYYYGPYYGYPRYGWFGSSFYWRGGAAHPRPIAPIAPIAPQPFARGLPQPRPLVGNSTPGRVHPFSGGAPRSSSGRSRGR